ncbi:MAG: hemolysin III family protein [Desulfococcaceae bacterium]
MKNMEAGNYYPPAEENINIISHAAGFILSIIASVFLLIHANLHGNIWHIVSFGIFGASLMILYAASAFYHSAKMSKLRKKLNIVDHASIYVLIAGTYTPFTLVTLKGMIGWVIFGISWGMALTGIILKLFFTGKFDLISTIMYVLMGWIIIFAIKPLAQNLPSEGVFWLFAGGISYTIGAVLYSIDKIKFNHAIFHIFVLMGSFCHFMSVFFYVLPGE